MTKLTRELVKNRKLIFELAKADFRKCFVGSYLGVIQMFVQPIVTVPIYFTILQLGFKSVPPILGVPYVIWLTPGVVPWFFFQEAMDAGTGCLQEYHYLVKKAVFNMEVLPVTKLVSCLFVYATFVMAMIVMFFCYGGLPLVIWLQLLYYSAAFSVLILALTLTMASVQVFFRDMTQLVSTLPQSGMWLVPIIWTPEMFDNFPPKVLPILKLNPIHYIMTGYRDGMISGNWFSERPMQTVHYWAATLVLLALGLRLFRKLRPHFSGVP